MKLAGSSHVLVSGNNVHDNRGQGLWSDGDDSNFTYSDNTVTNNKGVGIMYEISYDGTVIRNNTLSCNGRSGIYISNSNGVEVVGNTVTVSPANDSLRDGAANVGGIDIINDTRGSGRDGMYQSINNNIHHNVIIHPGDTAQDGVFIYQAITSPKDPNNVFDFNTYYVRDTTIPHWHFGRTDYLWQTLIDKTGSELHGTMKMLTKPMTVSCQSVTYGLSGASGMSKTLTFDIGSLATGGAG
jgi:parallel beta-helix repeat protein